MEYPSGRNPAGAQAGTGAAADAQLEPLSVLIEYYESEMGELPGRLMIAISFLNDAQLMPGWEKQSLEIQQAIEKAQALVVSVMSRMLKTQHDRAIKDTDKLGDEIFRKF